ncbi:MAG TPA: porin [Thermodesulfobacteriota bacterium]|nr:porin [Thermodesulfobacteriota bacterium]
MISRVIRNTEAVVILLLILLSPASSFAQSTKQQIEELKKQIEIIQLQNQKQIEEMKKQIESLQTERAADQEKIAEIKTKQETVDKDAWYNNFLAKYDKGFTFESSDEKGFQFKTRFTMLAQIQGIVNDTDGKDVATNFNIRRFELRWDGYAFVPWFYYTLMIDPAASSLLKDAYLTAAYQKEISPRTGQWKVPFNREELNSSSALQMVERSIVNAQFSLERDRGLALQGGIGKNNNVSYSAGVFNGDGLNGTSVDSNMLYAGRIQLGLGGDDFKFNPNGAFATARSYEIVPNFARKPTFTVGVAGSVLPGLDCAVKTPNGGVCDRITQLGFPTSDFSQLTADASFKMAFFNVEGEYDARWLAPDTGPQDTAFDQGFRVQAGVFLLPKTVELAARYALIDYDTSSGVVPPDTSVPSKQWELTPGLNYYFSHDHRWKLQLNYTFQRNEATLDAPDVDANIVRAQIQANF